MLDDGTRRRGGSLVVWDRSVGLTAGLSTLRAPFDSHSRISTIAGNSQPATRTACNNKEQ